MGGDVQAWRVGVDLGGTKIGLGLIDAFDRVVKRQRIPTQADQGVEAVTARIAHCVEEFKEELPTGERLAALGICSPGPVDHLKGMLLDPPNLPTLHYTPLGPMLEEKCRLPVILEHDAKASALGEFHYGAGRGSQNMVYIVVGTGVGAAIILNSELLRGERNFAGEVGHITLDRNGETCSCGSRGCVETFLAGPWLARRYLQARSADPEEQPVERANLSGEDIARLAGQDDPLAMQIFKEAGQALGVAVASIAMILNIDLFVIGSSVAKVGDLLLQPARENVTNFCYQSVGCNVRIVGSHLGDDAPLLGCAWLAKQLLGKIITV